MSGPQVGAVGHQFGFVPVLKSVGGAAGDAARTIAWSVTSATPRDRIG
ncbi:hypothetical protein H7H78_01440 [Mycobacterium shinjukuense]|nr:hypothetical protein [Mycobacterium shinjukuense]MCV6984158.1 hypothetical protein [Mycobacterium shinjukuense]